LSQVDVAATIDRSYWQRQRTLPLLLTLALVLRVAWWVTQVAAIENDGAEYARLAENWFGGRGFVGMFDGPQTFPPLYPALIGLFALPLANVEVAGRFVSLLSGVALVFVLYKLSGRLFGDAAALIAGLLTASHPLLVALSVSVYSESLTMLLVMVGLYLAIVAVASSELWRAAVAGVTIGGAYLMRPETIAFVGPIALALVVAERRKGRTWLRAIMRGLVPLAVAGAVALPYVVHLSSQAGHFRWEGKTAVNNVINARMQRGMSYPEAARGLNSSGEPGDPLHQGPFLAANQVIFLRERTAATDNVIAATPRRALRIGRHIVGAFFLGAPILVGLAVIGFVRPTWWRERLLQGLLLLAFGMLQTVFLLALQFTWDRFLFPLLPLMTPWAASGIERLCSGAAVISCSLFSRVRPEIVFHLVSIVLVLTLTGSLYPAVASLGEFWQASDSSVKPTARWLQQDSRGSKRPIVIAYGAAVPFHAGAIMRNYPYADESRALRYIHGIKPDYIAVRSTEMHQAPYVEEWLRRGIADDCAQLVHEVTSTDGIVTRLWRWRCGD
jgi:hypothetical protein